MEERQKQTRHVIAGGVEREAKMAVEPRHFHRRYGALSIQAFSSYLASHITDFPGGCQQPLKSIWIRLLIGPPLRGFV
jgi:hypothetical protein